MTETRPLVMRATVTLAAAARELEVSRDKIYQWIAAGYMRVVYIGPPEDRVRRIPREEVERFKQSA